MSGPQVQPQEYTFGTVNMNPPSRPEKTEAEWEAERRADRVDCAAVEKALGRETYEWFRSHGYFGPQILSNVSGLFGSPWRQKYKFCYRRSDVEAAIAEVKKIAAGLPAKF